jgi:hypothetical protein
MRLERLPTLDLALGHAESAEIDPCVEMSPACTPGRGFLFVARQRPFNRANCVGGLPCGPKPAPNDHLSHLVTSPAVAFGDVEMRLGAV